MTRVDELDVHPSRLQYEVLRALAEDDRLILEGSSTRFEKSQEIVRAIMVRSLVNNRWIAPPNYPLFSLDEPEAGRITSRGLRAIQKGY